MTLTITDLFCGAGGSSSGAASTLAALTRPPVTVRPANAAIGSTVRMSEYLTCGGVAAGACAQSRAATPATCGAAMEVPLNPK